MKDVDRDWASVCINKALKRDYRNPLTFVSDWIEPLDIALQLDLIYVDVKDDYVNEPLGS